ncbi:hypothetical protein C3495_10315 [Clostridiaceae bacterium 14S0207]|nr:hypothetical protein C3495_10315 [Clostridiaceae bacterium 14S0207]
MNKNRILKITIAIVIIFIIGISIKNNMNIKHNLIEAKLVIPNGGETFGALLRDKNLKIVAKNNIAKMYTISARPKPEKACVRDFNLETLKVGKRSDVMNCDSGGWASVHYALKVADDFYILFYTSNNGLSEPNKRGIRAAWSNTPNGKFMQYNTSQFEIIPREKWEGRKIEQDVGARKISEDKRYVYYWMLYSDINYETNPNSYSGWYKIRIDKVKKTVKYIDKYKNNPLTEVSLHGYKHNRVGGSNVQTKIGDYYLMYWMARNDNSDKRNTDHPRQVGFAASKDPLFHKVKYTTSVGGIIKFDAHCNEKYMEKFDYYINSKEELVLIGESVFKDVPDDYKFGVIARVYNIEEGISSKIRKMYNNTIKKIN